MRRQGAIAAFLCVLVLPATAWGAEATEVTVSDLLADPEVWDGLRVVVTGELVGDYSRRDDGVWVQLNDDVFATSPVPAGGEPEGTNTGIGARIPPEVFSEGVGGAPGRYGRHGPIVSIEGVFRHSDPDLGGETYVAVDIVRTLTPSRAFAVPGPDLWLAIGIGLILVAGAITWPHRTRRRAV